MIVQLKVLFHFRDQKGPLAERAFDTVVCGCQYLLNLLKSISDFQLFAFLLEQFENGELLNLQEQVLFDFLCCRISLQVLLQLQQLNIGLHSQGRRQSRQQ